MPVERVEEKIDRLRRERNAVVFAHNYQRGEVQDIADLVGDSLELARRAVEAEAEVIVLCGVHFMAETAAILNPDKTVVIPDRHAGCPMAAMASAKALGEFLAEHPGAYVVSYVNTTADVKAMSDVCCTSANAAAGRRGGSSRSGRATARRTSAYCPSSSRTRARRTPRPSSASTPSASRP